MMYDNLFDLGYHIAELTVKDDFFKEIKNLPGRPGLYIPGKKALWEKVACCWRFACVVKGREESDRSCWMTKEVDELVVEVRVPHPQFPDGVLEPGPIPDEFRRGVRAYIDTIGRQ